MRMKSVGQPAWKKCGLCDVKGQKLCAAVWSPTPFLCPSHTLSWCHNLKQTFKCTLWQKAREHVHAHTHTHTGTQHTGGCKTHLSESQFLQLHSSVTIFLAIVQSLQQYLKYFFGHLRWPHRHSYKSLWELWWLLFPWRPGDVSRSPGPAASRTVATVQPGTTAQVGHHVLLPLVHSILIVSSIFLFLFIFFCKWFF